MSSAAPAPRPRGAAGVATAQLHPVPQPPPSRGGRQRPTTLATALSLAAVAAVVAVQVLVPGGWGPAAWVVLVAGLLLGLAHGAVDHLVPGFVLAERAPRLLAVLAGYVAVAAGAWLAFRAVPAVALVVFVAVSAWHFGAGEVAFDAERADRAPRPDPLAVVAAGGSVLLLPVVSDPASVAPVIALLVPGSSGVLPRPLAVGVLVVVLAAVAATLVRRAAQRRCLDQWSAWLGSSRPHAQRRATPVSVTCTVLIPIWPQRRH